MVNALRSCHEEHDYHTPRNQKNVSNGVRNGVAQCGNFALGRILDGSERGRGRPSARDSAEVDRWMELENIFARQKSDDQWNRCDDEPQQKESEAFAFEAGYEAWAGGDSHHGNEGVQAYVAEDPQRRIRNAPKGAVNRAEPAADQARNQRAAARA